MAVSRVSAVLPSRWIRGCTALLLVVSVLTVGPTGVPRILQKAAAVDASCTDSSLPPPTSTTADPGVTTVIQQDGGTVEVPPAGVTSPTTIGAESLCASD